MNYENYFNDLVESKPDYKKIVFLMFLIRNDKDLLEECGFSKSDDNRLSLEFKKTLIEQNVEYLDHIKNQEKAIIEQFCDK